MNVQSLSCQPLKPSYQYKSTPSFGLCYDEDTIDISPVYEEEYDSADFSSLREEKAEFEEMAKNKDNKLLSAMGTLGAGFAAGALSFYTFKTMAPKGAAFAKKVYNKVLSLGIVQKTGNLIKTGYGKLKNAISNGLAKIKPESKLGKVKHFISEKFAKLKSKVLIGYNKVATPIKEFVKKHGINKDFAKKAANNTGATLVAIPAATTTVNAALEGKDGGEQ